MNRRAAPVVRMWRDQFRTGGVNPNNLAGLAVYSYAKTQEYLDEAVNAVNNLPADFVGSFFQEIAGQMNLNFMDGMPEYTCDMMFRMWNVAENCFDLEIPEIGDFLDRVQLPGLACAVEEFAFGGSGMRDVYDTVRAYEPGGDNYEPFTGIQIWENEWLIRGRETDTGRTGGYSGQQNRRR